MIWSLLSRQLDIEVNTSSLRTLVDSFLEKGGFSLQFDMQGSRHLRYVDYLVC